MKRQRYESGDTSKEDRVRDLINRLKPTDIKVLNSNKSKILKNPKNVKLKKPLEAILSFIDKRMYRSILDYVKT
jgi:hypothetical protein